MLPFFLLPIASVSALFQTANPNNFVAANKNGFIVELASDTPTATLRSSIHKRFYNHLESRGNKFSVKAEFSDNKLFHGASISFDENETITAEEIATLEGVLAVWPNRLYHSMDYELKRRSFQNAPDFKNMVKREVKNPLEGIKKREVKDPLEGIVKRKASSYPSTTAADFKNDKFGPHIQIAADKLHEKGILGKGIKVAVIDTGVDYKHPALGGGFGKGFKISFGKDLVGDKWGDGSDPVPDNDPYDPCNSHGTHVSGIVGADPNPYNFTGVAPQADLGHYRIFSCAGEYTSTELIIKALIAAFNDGADVITLSLGGASGWQTDPGAIVAERINNLGRITTIAAGNAGDQGLWYSSSPAGASSVWSVASIESPEILQTLSLTNTGRTIPYFSLLPFGVQLGIYATSTEVDPTSDGCEPFTIPKSVDLNKTAVVIKRGSCYIDNKLTNAHNAGAKYVLIANNGGASFYAGDNAALISTEDGEFLRRRFRENKKTVVDFTLSATVPAPNTGANYPSYFTNLGPTYDMLQQPTFSAPGGQYLSTYPLSLGGYAIISGTSMATPAVAGAAALWLSARKSDKLSPLQIRSIFSSTANFQNVSATSADLVGSVIQTGSGIIDVSKAVDSTTLISPNQLALNDTRFFKGTQNIKITNIGKKAKTYKFSHQAAATAYTFDKDVPDYISVLPEFSATSQATVSFSKKSITLQPFDEVEVTVTIKKPADDERYPVYSGLILLTSGSEVLKVPYFGVAGSLYDFPLLDTDTGIEPVPPPFIWTKSDPGQGLSANGTQQVGSATYSFEGESFPALVFRFLFGTPRGTVDLVFSNTTFTATVKDQYLDPKTAPAPKALNTRATTKYDSVPIVGNIPQFSGNYLTRDGSTGDEQLVWDGTLAVKGKTVDAPNGKYKFLLRALKVTGNPDVEEDYESWLSPEIVVKRS